MIAVLHVSFYYLISLSLVPLFRSHWWIEIVASVMQNYLESQYLINILWISLEKRECFNLNHSWGCLHYSIHHHLTSRLRWSFQLADLLSLFIKTLLEQKENNKVLTLCHVGRYVVLQEYINWYAVICYSQFPEWKISTWTISELWQP